MSDSDAESDHASLSEADAANLSPGLQGDSDHELPELVDANTDSSDDESTRKKKSKKAKSAQAKHRQEAVEAKRKQEEDEKRQKAEDGATPSHVAISSAALAPACRCERARCRENAPRARRCENRGGAHEGDRAAARGQAEGREGGGRARAARR